MGRGKYTKETLAEAAANADSVADVLRNLGLQQAGGTQAHVSRMLIRYGIDTSHFTRRKRHYERTPRRNPVELLTRRPPGSPRVHGARLKVALLRLGRREKCELCNLSPQWNGKALVLQVDHIDGDLNNNVAENLRLLCPNCHSQCPTFSMRRWSHSEGADTAPLDSSSERP